ncbi:hypothetical protein HDA32_000241 [Spinactinospora alkalitolerans]|uniref:Metalloprotease n=1 Tax=Spinactinospora alkalitolerans TaxID=687207 RepID=A0A852TNV4_9ACTN|nr:neutral zinc metallopeptidase [Spinactinospora alkalitolerans]NYE45121.1 hypothetical protein [Spinactinospora alkalitolerans]
MERRLRGRAALWAAIAAAVLALALLVWNVVAAGGGEQGIFGVASRSSATPDPDRAGGIERFVPGEGHRGLPGDAPEATGGTGGETDPDRPSGRTALLDNPLYDTGRLAPLPCPEPGLDVDDPESVEAFLNALTDCLDHTWQTQFDKAGIPFQPPERVFWETPGSSPCRDYPSTAGAFYCRAGKSVYIGTADVVEKWNGADNGIVYASLLAHEYAHHVQGESGLLDYYHEQRRLEPEVVDQNAWTRKSELQANCLAGAFLGAVRVSYPVSATDRDAVLDDAAATADRPDSTDEERTHGSAANSVRWMEHGMDEQSPGACNTWEAASETVQ